MLRDQQPAGSTARAARQLARTAPAFKVPVKPIIGPRVCLQLKDILFVLLMLFNFIQGDVAPRDDLEAHKASRLVRCRMSPTKDQCSADI